MREIEFRGKDVNTGKWVYSSAIANGTVKGKQNNKYMLVDNESDIWCEVDPETIGQYTGLKDVNDVKIFEGDIVKVSSRRDWTNGVVFYNEENTCFSFRIINEMLSECEQDWRELRDGWLGVEVIGNVTDNPELLGG